MIRIPEPTTALTLPMPYKRLRYNLACIGWTQGELGRRARLDEGTVRQMCRGHRTIPDELALWTEHLATLHRALPEPSDWHVSGKYADPATYPMPEFDPDPSLGDRPWRKYRDSDAADEAAD